MRKTHKWHLSAAIAGIVAIATLAALLAYHYAPLPTSKLIRQQEAGPHMQTSRSGKNTLCERAGWVPQDFFKAPEAIRACEVITARDQARLQALIDGGLDVNLTGKSGMTLLYWAFVNDNSPAFDLLLNSEADPDKKLTSSVFVPMSSPFAVGDSILFTCLRSAWKPGQLEFFFAALSHSKEIDPRDSAGNTLLLVALDARRPDKASVARIIKFGVNLDAQTKDGRDTAAMVAVWQDRPQLAQQILEAGADPNIRNHRGQSVADVLRRKLELEKGNQHYPKKEAAQLLEWLEKQSPPDANNAPEQP